MAKIGFIGTGNMGFAILQGLLKLYRPEDLLFTDVNQERMETVKKTDWRGFCGEQCGVCEPVTDRGAGGKAPDIMMRC